jgi:hypothetical protein
MDNDPEFISLTLAAPAEMHAVKLELINPDKPIKSGVRPMSVGNTSRNSIVHQLGSMSGWSAFSHAKASDNRKCSSRLFARSSMPTGKPSFTAPQGIVRAGKPLMAANSGALPGGIFSRLMG